MGSLVLGSLTPGQSATLNKIDLSALASPAGVANSIEDILDSIERRALVSPATGNSVADILNAVERRALGAGVANSIADKLAQILTRVPAGGFATQYGTVTINGAVSAAATISAVDVTKSVVLTLGWTEANAAGSISFAPYLALTNSTTVTATRVVNNPTNTVVSFVVLTFAQPVSSIQTGTTVIAGAVGSATSTISSVTTSKALLAFGGVSVSVDDATYLAYATLTNATTITATRTGAAAGTTTVSWAVVAF